MHFSKVLCIWEYKDGINTPTKMFKTKKILWTYLFLFFHLLQKHILFSLLTHELPTYSWLCELTPSPTPRKIQNKTKNMYLTLHVPPFMKQKNIFVFLYQSFYLNVWLENAIFYHFLSSRKITFEVNLDLTVLKLEVMSLSKKKKIRLSV